MESLNLKTKIIIGIAIVIAIVVIGLYFYKESKNDDTYDDTLAVTTENEEETEDEENLGMKVSKKSFSSFKNQFMLDENGEFEEEFASIEECLEWILF